MCRARTTESCQKANLQSLRELSHVTVVDKHRLYLYDCGKSAAATLTQTAPEAYGTRRKESSKIGIQEAAAIVV